MENLFISFNLVGGLTFSHLYIDASYYWQQFQIGFKRYADKYNFNEIKPNDLLSLTEAFLSWLKNIVVIFEVDQIILVFSNSNALEQSHWHTFCLRPLNKKYFACPCITRLQEQTRECHNWNVVVAEFEACSFICQQIFSQDIISTVPLFISENKNIALATVGVLAQNSYFLQLFPLASQIAVIDFVEEDKKVVFILKNAELNLNHKFLVHKFFKQASRLFQDAIVKVIGASLSGDLLSKNIWKADVCKKAIDKTHTFLHGDIDEHNNNLLDSFELASIIGFFYFGELVSSLRDLKFLYVNALRLLAFKSDFSGLIEYRSYGVRQFRFSTNIRDVVNQHTSNNFQYCIN